MFIELAFRYLNDYWRYIVGFIVIFFIWQMGSIPFFIVAMLKLIQEGGSINEIQEDPNLLMTILDSNLTFFLMLLSFAIGFLGLWLWLKLIHNQPLQAITTTRKKIDWSRFWFSFGLIASITIITTLFDYVINPEHYEVQFQVIPFLILAVIAILLIPIQTSFEELLFRGYLLQGIGMMTKNRWAPLLFTSVLFGGLHFFNPEVEKLGNAIMFYYIGTGLFLGIITLMDEGLELALGFHAGNNLIGALLVTADWTAFNTNSIFKDISDPSAGVDVIMPLIIIYPVFLGIMAWRYQWSNWNEKLMGEVAAPILPEEEISE